MIDFNTIFIINAIGYRLTTISEPKDPIKSETLFEDNLAGVYCNSQFKNVMTAVDEGILESVSCKLVTAGEMMVLFERQKRAHSPQLAAGFPSASLRLTGGRERANLKMVNVLTVEDSLQLAAGSFNITIGVQYEQ
jgi:hypothetical protein